MKVLLSWLKEYVDIDVTVPELEEKFFGAGFEVEETKYVFDMLNTDEGHPAREKSDTFYISDNKSVSLSFKQTPP